MPECTRIVEVETIFPDVSWRSRRAHLFPGTAREALAGLKARWRNHGVRFTSEGDSVTTETSHGPFRIVETSRFVDEKPDIETGGNDE